MAGSANGACRECDHGADAAVHLCEGRLSGYSLTSGRYTSEGGSFRQPLYVGSRKRAEQRGESNKIEMGAKNGKKEKSPRKVWGCIEERFVYFQYWELTSMGTASSVVIELELTS